MSKSKRLSKVETEEIPKVSDVEHREENSESEESSYSTGDSNEISEEKEIEEKPIPPRKVAVPKVAKKQIPKEAPPAPAKAAGKAKLPTLRLLKPSPSPVVKTTPQIPLISSFQRPRTGDPQEVLKELLVKGENEDDSSFQQRKAYSEAALRYSKQDITPETAVALGEIMLKKAKYDVTYSETVERLLALVNRELEKKF